MLLTEQIDELYKPSGSFIFNYLIPIIIISVWLYNVIALLIKIQLSSTKLSWKQNKCSPSYLFVSGLIEPVVGESAALTTKNNFNECVLNASVM